jgi:endophilin-A
VLKGCTFNFFLIFRPKTLEDLGIERTNSYDSLAGGGSGLGSSNNHSTRPSAPSGSFSSIHSLPVSSSNLISTSPSASPATTPVSFSGRAGNSPAFDDAWGQPAVSLPTPLPRPNVPHHNSSSSPSQPSCRALYDFDAENPAELSFKEGDIILLKTQIDENWYEGTVKGRTGYFPVTYVTIVIPLPKF